MKKRYFDLKSEEKCKAAEHENDFIGIKAISLNIELYHYTLMINPLSQKPLQSVKKKKFMQTMR